MRTQAYNVISQKPYCPGEDCSVVRACIQSTICICIYNKICSIHHSATFKTAFYLVRRLHTIVNLIVRILGEKVDCWDVVRVRIDLHPFEMSIKRKLIDFLNFFM